ncbi:MAG: hypothetical protein HY272_02875 [Gammaproteobacteria bacterium]|nr:hypothetical protein [Gammaproteobacteria bacterium]
MKYPLSNSHPKHRLWVAYGLFVLWLIFTLWGFWWFEFRLLQPFTDQPQAKMHLHQKINAQQAWKSYVTTQAAPAQVTVLYFWDTDCSCSKFTDVHVRQLMDTYKSRDVRFVVIPRPGGHTPDTGYRYASNKRFGEAIIAQLDSAAFPVKTPAAAVLDSKGTMAYFGPYSDSPNCGANKNGPVETAINNLLAGEKFTSTQVKEFGCYCNSLTRS